MNKRLPQQLGSFIWHFLKRYKTFMYLFITFAILTGAWAPLNSLLIKFMIDGLTVMQKDGSYTYIIWLAILFILNFEVHNLGWRGMAYLNYKYEPVIKNEMISETFGYVHQHSHQFFQENLSGGVASQINRLADSVERIIHDLSRHIIRGIVLLIVSLASMYYVHLAFFLALLIWLIVFTLFSLYYSNRMIALSEEHASAESEVAGRLVDSITNASTVRMFARRLYEIAYLQTSLLKTKKTFQKKEIFALKLHFFQGISLSLMLGFMLYFLIVLWQKNQVTLGDFALILGLSVEVGYMTWWTLEQVDELNKLVGKCKQSLVALFVPLTIKDKENAPQLNVTRGEIMFSKVKFHYKGAEPLFQNKTVTIAAGQKVGLVGYSGSGKTTFVNLILRLYDVSDGRILIDDQNICDVTQDSLREAIAMIPQDPSLFHRTLMENIRYGREQATDREVKEAARRAHAKEFIGKLPLRYASLVGERGVKLSGGQRQRVAIARAILKNAPILILDEATSQLDSITEMRIQESLWELMQNKTSIVVAHRLSTLLYMDRIMVFDRGKIVQDGSHEELLLQPGLYKTLWDAQVGGFLPDKKGGDE